MPAWITQKVVVDGALVLLYVSFARRHYEAFLATGEAITVLYAALEACLVVLFLLRRCPAKTTRRPFSWITAIIGTAGPLLFLPGMASVSLAAGKALTVVGIALVFSGYVSINRSFGIVPADRGLKTGGAYALVRHPIYAGYVLVVTGYLLTSVSWWNGAVVALIVASIALRVTQEERFLADHADYADYAAKVPARFIPGLF